MKAIFCTRCGCMRHADISESYRVGSEVRVALSAKPTMAVRNADEYKTPELSFRVFVVTGISHTGTALLEEKE